MSTAEVGMRIGRSYTRARRMPWVMGKIGDWTLPFGPYTPAQIGVAFAGAFLLIKTWAWWRVFGPAPVVALAVAVWAVRRARIGGRTPVNCALGIATYLLQPRAGRINGRGVREGRPSVLHGGCVIEDAPLTLDSEQLRGGTQSAARSARAGTWVRTSGARLRPADRLPRRGRRKAAVPQPPVRPAPTALQQMMRGRDETSYVTSEGGAES
ncbi:hypothetical protein [Streptomyces lydicus]|uniref:hypothetical protein n=1 Tax=Streptomyces lydicus TaxID=47763 RepID=UPI0036EB01DD